MPARMVALEMQATGCNDAEQSLQGREGNAALAAARQPWRFTALQVGLVLRRQAIRRMRDRVAEAGRGQLRLQNSEVAIGCRMVDRQRAAAGQCRTGGGKTLAQEVAPRIIEPLAGDFFGQRIRHEVFRCGQQAAEPLLAHGNVPVRPYLAQAMRTSASSTLPASGLTQGPGLYTACTILLLPIPPVW